MDNRIVGKAEERPLARMKTPLREKIRVGAKRQLTLPAQALAALGLEEGDFLELRICNGKVELVPLALVPREQAWFWTPEWQAREREAERARAAGDFTQHKRIEDVVRKLKA